LKSSLSVGLQINSNSVYKENDFMIYPEIFLLDKLCNGSKNTILISFFYIAKF
jgi:hypothetical protein